MISFIIWGLIAITLLIFFHELGHLLAAKSSGVEVEKFSIGFGPPIIKKRINKTEYSISLIPLGGYVKMKGEDFEEEGFYTLPLLKKAKVSLAGPLFNLLLGFLIGIFIFSIYGQSIILPVVESKKGSSAYKAGILTGDRILFVNKDSIEDYSELLNTLSNNRGREMEVILKRKGRVLKLYWKVPEDSLGIEPLIPPIVGRVRHSGPADRIGMREGDEIISINGKEVSSWEALVKTIRNSQAPLSLGWLRQGRYMEARVMPETVWDPQEKRKVAQIGVIVYMPKKRFSFVKAITHSAGWTSWITIKTFSVIYQIIISKVSRRALGGPILIAQLSKESISWGMEYFLSLLAILSLNLFLINLLPIPVLDGGRFLIFLIEGVRGRNFSKKEWGTAIQIGWLFILLIVFFATFNDILRLLKR